MSIEEAIELLERSIRDGQRMIDEHSLLTDEHGYKEFEDGINARKAILALLKTHPETQPNEPLTMEELREMGGQPVFIVFDAEGYEPVFGWALVDALLESVAGINIWFNFEDYGIWKAYRRPPKDEK